MLVVGPRAMVAQRSKSAARSGEEPPDMRATLQVAVAIVQRPPITARSRSRSMRSASAISITLPIVGCRIPRSSRVGAIAVGAFRQCFLGNAGCQAGSPLARWLIQLESRGFSSFSFPSGWGARPDPLPIRRRTSIQPSARALVSERAARVNRAVRGAGRGRCPSSAGSPGARLRMTVEGRIRGKRTR